jgi:hypothetical protein
VGEEERSCEDTHKKAGECKEWAQRGQCTENARFMEMHCRRSCNLCCTDVVDTCTGWAKDGQCSRVREERSTGLRFPAAAKVLY